MIGVNARDARAAWDDDRLVQRQRDELRRRDSEPARDERGSDSRGVDVSWPPLGEANIMVGVEVREEVDVVGRVAAREAVDDVARALDALDWSERAGLIVAGTAKAAKAAAAALFRRLGSLRRIARGRAA